MCIDFKADCITLAIHCIHIVGCGCSILLTTSDFEIYLHLLSVSCVIFFVWVVTEKESPSIEFGRLYKDICCWGLESWPLGMNHIFMTRSCGSRLGSFCCKQQCKDVSPPPILYTLVAMNGVFLKVWNGHMIMLDNNILCYVLSYSSFVDCSCVIFWGIYFAAANITALKQKVCSRRNKKHVACIRLWVAPQKPGPLITSHLWGVYQSLFQVLSYTAFKVKATTTTMHKYSLISGHWRD